MTEGTSRPAAVADSSPLIGLAAIGKLDLLQDLLGPVAVPPAVWSEVVSKGAGKPGAREVGQANWIRTVELKDQKAASRLQQDHQLQRGEAEAIALVRELGDDVVLVIDEKRGRRYAEQAGMRTVGAVGILSLAAKAGRAGDLGASIAALRASGFRVSDAVEQRAFRLSGRTGEPE